MRLPGGKDQETGDRVRNLGSGNIMDKQEGDHMSYRLIIDGNSVYEIDEDFERYRKKKMADRAGKRSRQPEGKEREEPGENGPESR